LKTKNAFLEIDLGPIHKAFEDPSQLPDINPGPIGRLRLVEALRGRYGDNYRINRTARNALKHFDSETKMIKHYVQQKNLLKGEPDHG